MEQKEKNSKLNAAYLRWASIGAGFLLGFYTYWTWKGLVPELKTIWDVLYHTLDLMTGAAPLDGTESGLMLWSRFLCPTSTCLFLLTYFSAGIGRLILCLRSLSPSSVAIYGSNALVRSASEGTHFIQSGNQFLPHAKKHIILMDNDDESLTFYTRHEPELSKDTTYIGLQQMSSFLMRSIPNVFYFNIYEEVARSYWKDCSLLPEMKARREYSIVILGYCRDNLGYQLLKYGVMNNLFRGDQKIAYHVFCKSTEAERGFELLDMMNGDAIHWHTEQWQRQQDVIRGADRILLCRTVNPHILNQLLLICTTQQIHYYDPDIASYPEKYEYPYMHAFGCTKTVLNEGSILKSELHRDAVERNFRYEKQYGTDAQKDRIRAAEKKRNTGQAEAGAVEQPQRLYQELQRRLLGLLQNPPCNSPFDSGGAGASCRAGAHPLVPVPLPVRLAVWPAGGTAEGSRNAYSQPADSLGRTA